MLRKVLLPAAAMLLVAPSIAFAAPATKKPVEPATPPAATAPAAPTTPEKPAVKVKKHVKHVKKVKTEAPAPAETPSTPEQ